MSRRAGWLTALLVIFVAALVLGVWFGAGGGDGGTGTLDLTATR
jgi:ABC-type transporter Mla subunit MlaD